VPGDTYDDVFKFFEKKNAAKEEWPLEMLWQCAATVDRRELAAPVSCLKQRIFVVP